MATIYATTQQPPQNVTVVITTKRQDQYRRKLTIGAWLLFVGGGMEITLGLGWSMTVATWAFQYSWFVAFICGAILSAPFIRILPKMIYYAFGTLLTFIASIIYLSVPYNYDAVIAARCLSGFGIGFITMPYLVHIGEISPSKSGSGAGLEQSGYSLGICIQVIFSSVWSADLGLTPIRYHGIFMVVCAIVSFISLVANVESPVFYILRNDDARALETQRRLLLNTTPPDVSQAIFDELKLYVAESERTTIAQSVSTFIKMLVYRCFVAFCFSLPLNDYLRISSAITTFGSYNWPPTVYGILRLLGSLLSIVFMDVGMGQRLSSLLSLAVMSGLMLALPYYVYYLFDSLWYTSVMSRIIMAFSFFAGMFTPSTSVYLSQAFSVKTKPYFIVLCISIEQLIHVIVIVSSFNAYSYFLAVGIIMIVGLLAFDCVLPETRGLSMLEAQRRFYILNHVRAY